MRQSILLRLIIVLVGVFLLALVYSYAPPAPRSSPEETDLPEAGPIVLSGTLVCLPHRDTRGPQTLECAFGIKDEEERYFALRDTDPQYKNLGGVSMNASVTVRGTFTPEKHRLYQSIGSIAIDSILLGIWKREVDVDTKVSFLFPKTFSTEFVQPIDWPPAVAFVKEPFACTEKGKSDEPAGRSESRRIGERTYCVTEETGAAAGSRYTQYAYATEIEGRTIMLTFSLRRPECGNFDVPVRDRCLNEQEAFDLHSIVEDIVGSLSLQE